MTTSITYDDKTVRRFMTASIIWGIVGMLVGVLAATQLSWWQMNGKFLETVTDSDRELADYLQEVLKEELSNGVGW